MHCPEEAHIQAEIMLVTSRGLEEAEILKYKISFCNDGNVLELDNADICATL